LPKLFEVYPTRKPITATKDFAALIEAGDAALPRASGLLAAVHDALPQRLPTPLPTPDRTYIDRIFENRGTTSVALPGGLGRRSVDLAPGQFTACDGRVWYRVEQVGAGPESSFYPSDFTRELFRLFVNDKQLRLKTELSLQFAIELAVLKSNTNCQWVLVIELGTAPQDTAPGATGINLQNVVWSPAPVLQQRIIVTPAPCIHVFGIRVKRFLSGGAEVITLDQILYGSAEGGIAPTSANFAVRARLVRFDTDNNQTDPRGFIALRGLDLPEGESQELPDIGKAIIRN
jgi:hypothetical protein